MRSFSYRLQPVTSLTKNLDGILAELSELYIKVWQEPPWNEVWTVRGAKAELTSLVQSDHSIVVAALDLDDKVLGMCGGYPIDTVNVGKRTGGLLAVPDDVRVFYIAEVLVEVKSRRHGAGIRLSEEVISAAKKAGHNMIVLRTDVSAYPARSLFSRLGFRDSGITDVDHFSRTYWTMFL